MLTLSEVEKGHHSSLLVLWRIPFEDLIDELVVLFGELERDTRIVFGAISMLWRELSESASLIQGLRGNLRLGVHRWQLSCWL